MDRRSVQYFLPEHGMSAQDPYTLEIGGHRDIVPKYVAELAASDYHYNRGGWGSTSWPVKITLILPGDNMTFEVDREAVPSFRATRCQ